MKKGLQLFLVAGALVALVLLGGQEFPKYAVRLAAFSGFIFLEILFWHAFRNAYSQHGLLARWLTGIIYWFPLLLLTAFVVAAASIPISNWLPFFRIYVPGTLVVLYIGKIILMLFMLAGEVFSLPENIITVFKKAGKNHQWKWKRLHSLTKAGLVVSLLVMSVFVLGMVKWVYDFKVRHLVISIDQLPASFNGFKIVQVSDIHLGSWRSAARLSEAVSAINSQKADLVVFTGDMVNFSSAETLPFAHLLRQVKAPMGVYAVKGNHDYGDYISWDTPAAKDKNVRDLNAFYKSIGWILLDNTHQLLTRNGETIVLVGVENWSVSKLYGKRGNLVKALTGTEQPGFKILLSHDPTHWDTEVSEDYPDIDLTLSGHTHAMQIGWESDNFRWSPAQWKYNEWAGLYEHDSPRGRQLLYVNRGLGHIAYPGRIGIDPEITVIQLVRGL